MKVNKGRVTSPCYVTPPAGCNKKCFNVSLYRCYACNATKYVIIEITFRLTFSCSNFRSDMYFYDVTSVTTIHVDIMGICCNVLLKCNVTALSNACNTPNHDFVSRLLIHYLLFVEDIQCFIRLYLSNNG